jgi:hypothetical protein
MKTRYNIVPNFFQALYIADKRLSTSAMYFTIIAGNTNKNFPHYTVIPILSQAVFSALSKVIALDDESAAVAVACCATGVVP